MTKLHDALLAGNNRAALDLIEAGGISLDAQDDKGRTALMLAFAQSQNRVGRKLLEKGARTKLTDVHGRTALDMARAGDNAAGRDMLYRLLTPPEVRAEMFHAAQEGDLDSLKFLVEEMNAKLNDKSSRGKTALEEAEVCTQFEVAGWIEDKLASFPDDAGREMLEGAKQDVKPMRKIVFKNG